MLKFPDLEKYRFSKIVFFKRFLILVTIGFCASLSHALEPLVNDYVLRFNVDRYALAPDDEQLKLGDSFTMMGWFFWDEEVKDATLMGQLSANWPEWPDFAQILQTRYGDGVIEFGVSDGTEVLIISATEPTPVGEWVHLAAVLDGGWMRLFINGAEVSNGPFSGSPVSDVARFSIGSGVNSGPYTAGSRFNGFISEVSVWTKGLSLGEIQNAATVGLTGNEDGLVAYWKLDDQPESFVVQDYSGNGLDMRLDQSVEGPYWARWRPLQYPMEAVENPYFEVIEFDWPGATSIIEHSLSDMYIIDLNNDGLDDIVISQSVWPDFPELSLIALRNQGDLTFTEFTDSKLGSVNTITARQGRVSDYDGDGLDDLFLIDTGSDVPPFPGWQNTLLLGNADGLIRDVSSTHLPLLNDLNHGLDIGDIDGDGDIDIFTGQQPAYWIAPWFSFEGSKPEIFINDGTGQFTLERERLPESEQLHAAPAVGLLDADRDGFPDVFFSHQAMYDTVGDGRNPIVRLKNDGTGSFEFPNSGDIIDNEFFHLPDWMGVEMASVDVNNDGYLDLLIAYQGVPDDGGGIWLFLNNQDDTFTKIENAFPSEYFDVIHSGWWIIYLRTADFNGDGWIDVHGEGVAIGDYLFLNNGDNTFTNASSILSPKVNTSNSISNVLDIDNDGRLDILSVADGKIQVLRNVRDFSTGAPYTPVPTAPMLGAVESIQVGEKLSWQDTGTAYAFDLEIASDPEFEDIVYQRSEYTGLSIEPANLQEGATYYWRVRGINTQGTGLWSEGSDFEVSLPPIIQPPVNDYVLRFSENRYALAPDDERLKLGDSFTMMGWFFWDEEPKEATLMGQLSADLAGLAGCCTCTADSGRRWLA